MNGNLLTSSPCNKRVYYNSYVKGLRVSYKGHSLFSSYVERNFIIIYCWAVVCIHVYSCYTIYLKPNKRAPETEHHWPYRSAVTPTSTPASWDALDDYRDGKAEWPPPMLLLRPLPWRHISLYWACDGFKTFKYRNFRQQIEEVK